MHRCNYIQEARKDTEWNRQGMGGGGGAGGGTDSLSLGTNCETTAPLFDKGQPLVLLSPNLHPPLFMNTQEQPPNISIKWEFSVLHMSYFTKLLYSI